MNSIELSVRNAEESMRRINGTCVLRRTECPDIFCSVLPTHWRSNKSLPTPFVVLSVYPIADGTKVTVSAGNEENSCADLKNFTAEFNGQLARFSDLRFVGKSGRGKNFNITITIQTTPTIVAIVSKVIKVTVDGPRDSRNMKIHNIKESNRKRSIPMPDNNSMYMKKACLDNYMTSQMPPFTMPTPSNAEIIAPSMQFINGTQPSINPLHAMMSSISSQACPVFPPFQPPPFSQMPMNPLYANQFFNHLASFFNMQFTNNISLSPTCKDKEFEQLPYPTIKGQRLSKTPNTTPSTGLWRPYDGISSTTSESSVTTAN
uniref:Runt domain-containing protein n=1 Tax=Rhabditophanes sp. KR3021 TaxID=114890 RepID=A0AC35UC21_9BILA